MKKIVSCLLVLSLTASMVFASPVRQVAVSFETPSNEVVPDVDVASNVDLFAAVNAMPLTLAEMKEVEGEGVVGAIGGAVGGFVSGVIGWGSVSVINYVISGTVPGSGMDGLNSMISSGIHGAIIGAVVGFFAPTP